jgi:hypothetical protein
VRLYGFAARGVATFPPDTPFEEKAGSPIPLYKDREPVQEAIDAQNRKHGTGALHVQEYEVKG